MTKTPLKDQRWCCTTSNAFPKPQIRAAARCVIALTGPCLSAVLTGKRECVYHWHSRTPILSSSLELLLPLPLLSSCSSPLFSHSLTPLPCSSPCPLPSSASLILLLSPLFLLLSYLLLPLSLVSILTQLIPKLTPRLMSQFNTKGGGEVSLICYLKLISTINHLLCRTDYFLH